MKTKNYLNFLILFLFLFLFNFSLLAKNGGDVGGGADFKYIEYMVQSMPQEVVLAKYRNTFLTYAKLALEDFKTLLFTNHLYTSDHKTLTLNDLNTITLLINDFEIKNNFEFEIDSNLKDSKDNAPRIAYNEVKKKFSFSDGMGFKKINRITLNPKEFGSALDSTLDSFQAENVRKATAIHEFLSLLEIESTGNFSFSSILLNKDTMESHKKALEGIKKIFPKLNEEIFTSCVAQGYKRKGEKRIPFWSTIVPMRTYITWALMDNDIRKDESGLLYFNPNFVDGTSSGCYALNSLSAHKMVSSHWHYDRDLRNKFRMKLNEKEYLDVCYVIGDRPDPKNHGSRFLLTRFNVNTPWIPEHERQTEVMLDEQKENATLYYRDIEVDIQCGNAREIN